MTERTGLERWELLLRWERARFQWDVVMVLVCTGSQLLRELRGRRTEVNGVGRASGSGGLRRQCENTRRWSGTRFDSACEFFHLFIVCVSIAYCVSGSSVAPTVIASSCEL